MYSNSYSDSWTYSDFLKKKNGTVLKPLYDWSSKVYWDIRNILLLNDIIQYQLWKIANLFINKTKCN